MGSGAVPQKNKVNHTDESHVPNFCLTHRILIACGAGKVFSYLQLGKILIFLFHLIPTLGVKTVWFSSWISQQIWASLSTFLGFFFLICIYLKKKKRLGFGGRLCMVFYCYLFIVWPLLKDENI